MRFSGRQGVGDAAEVESAALVGDRDAQLVGGGLEAGADVLGRVVAVAVHDGVDGGLTRDHGEVAGCVWVEADARGEVQRRFLAGFDAAEHGTEHELHAAGVAVDQINQSQTKGRAFPLWPEVSVVGRGMSRNISLRSIAICNIVIAYRDT